PAGAVGRHAGVDRLRDLRRRRRGGLQVARRDRLRTRRVGRAFERGFSMSEKRLVVVGDGMVGRRFLEAVVERDPSWSVTVLSEEPRPAYDRVRLSAFFDGVSAEELSLASDLPGVDVRLGEPATAIDLAAKVVRTESGTYAYDKLVLATGSYPFVPPMEGA